MTSNGETGQVRDIIARVAHHIDAKQWDELRALYAEHVQTDYTSLFGGTPRQQTGDALIAGWRGALDHVRTQHLLGPITVELRAGVATARCHVRAFHRATGAPGGEDWEVLGHYCFSLQNSAAGWRITAMTLETLLQVGNLRLLAETPRPAG